MDHKLNRIVAKVHYDNHPSRLRTLDEALDCVPSVNFRDTDFTDRQIIVFCEKGYLAWTLDKERNVRNYNSYALLSPYNFDIKQFVEAKTKDKNLVLMIPMDVPALQAIQENGDSFDEQARYGHLGVPKHIGLKHSFSMHSSSNGNGERERLGLER